MTCYIKGTKFLKVPIIPKNFFRWDVSLHHAEQNGAKIFVLGQNRNFLWIFKVAKNRGLKTHNRAAEFAERAWVECNFWRNTRTSIVAIVTSMRSSKSELKLCLRSVLCLAVVTFETRRKALSFIQYLFMVKATRRWKNDGKSGSISWS